MKVIGEVTEGQFEENLLLCDHGQMKKENQRNCKIINVNYK